MVLAGVQLTKHVDWVLILGITVVGIFFPVGLAALFVPVQKATPNEGGIGQELLVAASFLGERGLIFLRTSVRFNMNES